MTGKVMTQKEYNERAMEIDLLKNAAINVAIQNINEKFYEMYYSLSAERIKTICEEKNLDINIGDIISCGDNIIKVERITYVPCQYTLCEDGISYQGEKLTKKLVPRKDGSKFTIGTWYNEPIVKL